MPALNFRATQTSVSTILVEFEYSFVLNSALLQKTSYGLTGSVQNIQIASVVPCGTTNMETDSIILQLNKPWIKGKQTLQVTYSGFQLGECQESDLTGSSVSKVVEKDNTLRYFFIDIQGIPESYPSAPSILMDELSDGYDASIIIPHEYIEQSSFSSIGNKLELDKGSMLNDVFSVELIDFDGRLQELFATENDTTKKMVVWQEQTGSAYAAAYLRQHTEANQDVRFLTIDGGDEFEIDDYVWIGSNTLKIVDKTSVGTFNGEDLYEYEIQSRINKSDLEQQTGRQIAKSNPQYFSGRMLSLYEYCESRHGAQPKRLFTGIMDEPEIASMAGGNPVSWKLSVKDLSTLFQQKGPSRLTENEPVPLVRFKEEPFKITFRRVPVTHMIWDIAARTVRFGTDNIKVPLVYFTIGQKMVGDAFTDENPADIYNDGLVRVNFTSNLYQYASVMSQTITFELPGEMTPEDIATEMNEILYWDGNVFWPKALGGLLQEGHEIDALNSSTANASTTRTPNSNDSIKYIYIPEIYRLPTYSERLDEDGNDYVPPATIRLTFEKGILVESITAKFLRHIGWGECVDTLSSITDSDTSEYHLDSDETLLQVLPFFTPENPTFNAVVADDNVSEMARFFLDRNPPRDSTSTSATMNDDLDFSEVRRGWDEFTNNITISSRGYYNNTSTVVANFILSDGWRGISTHYSTRRGIGIWQSSYSNQYYDYIDAVSMGTDGKSPNSTKPLSEYIHVGYIPGPDTTNLRTSNPVQWLRAFITSTGRGTNGDFDLLPGRYSLGLDEAFIDSDSFDAAQKLTSPMYTWGAITKDTSNVWSVLAQSLIFPCGFYLCVKRDGTIKLSKISRRIAHGTFDATITTDDILATKLGSNNTLDNAYDAIKLTYDEKYLPPGWDVKDFTVKAVDGLTKGVSSATLSFNSFVSMDKGLLTNILQRRILPVLKRPNLIIEFDVPAISNSTGIKFLNVNAGDVVYLDSVPIPNRKNTSTLETQAIVIESKYDIVKDIVSLKVLALDNQSVQRGLSVSPQIINVDTGTNTITVRKSDFEGDYEQPLQIEDDGKFKIIYNASVQNHVSDFTASAYSSVLSKDILCWQITTSGITASGAFDETIASTSTTVKISGDARDRYWAGLKIYTNHANAFSGDGYTISDVSFDSTDTTITVSDVFVNAVANGTLVWTNNTCIVAADADENILFQDSFVYAASGDWNRTANGQWINQPLICKVDSSTSKTSEFSI